MLPDDHPVTQVSWNDACAYCEFYNKTLPSEVQWEYAASERGEKKNQLYYWGNELIVDNKYMCNTWTSGYPENISSQDGFKYTSPVGHFDSNSLGIFDMSGNVWEWCFNWHLMKVIIKYFLQIFKEKLKEEVLFFVILIIVMVLDFLLAQHLHLKVLYFMLDLDV